MAGITSARGTPDRRGPVEGDHVIGYDHSRTVRPGVPMHADPALADGAPASEPVPQDGRDERIHRAALDTSTPVFGTAQPLHGLSGAIRRGAYQVPEHHARHWMLLMLADRVDVLEGRVGSVLAAPMEAAGAEGLARRLRSNPLPVLAGMAGLITGAVVVRRFSR